MKVCVIQSKYGIVMDVGVSVKHWITGALVKKIIYEILVRLIVSVIKHVKLRNIWIL